MPATMTHQMFAIEVIQKSNSTWLKKHEDILMLATQGPDPFFFYGMLPWKQAKDKNRIQGIGSYLHHENPNKHLHIMYKKAMELNDNVLKAYAIGAMMHYILDKHVHPYVFSRSGFDSNGKLSKPYNIYHSHMETLMDTQLRHIKKLSSSDVHPYKKIKVSKEKLLKIDILYHESYKDLCNRKDYLKAVYDMQSIYNIVYGRLGFKRFLLKILLGKNSHPYAVSHPKSLKGIENKDFLNIHHIQWRHPETGEISKQSVTDLFDKALSEMLDIIHAIEENRFDGDYRLGDISYDGMHPKKIMTYQTMMFPLER